MTDFSERFSFFFSLLLKHYNWFLALPAWKSIADALSILEMGARACVCSSVVKMWPRISVSLHKILALVPILTCMEIYSRRTVYIGDGSQGLRLLISSKHVTTNLSLFGVQQEWPDTYKKYNYLHLSLTFHLWTILGTGFTHLWSSFNDTTLLLSNGSSKRMSQFVNVVFDWCRGSWFYSQVKIISLWLMSIHGDGCSIVTAEHIVE